MTGARREVTFSTFDQVLAEARALQMHGYEQLGQWSLGQVCGHLATVIDDNRVVPDSDTPTEEEDERRDGFFAMLFAPGGMPAGLPLKNPPSADLTEAEIDHLSAAFTLFDAFDHPFLKVGRAGPVAKEKVRQLHLLHSGHHFSFLIPRRAPTPPSPTPPGRRWLRFETLADVKSDVARLQKGYEKAGQWSLPMVCWHLATVADKLGSSTTMTDPTPEQVSRRAVLEKVLDGGPLPTGLPMPEPLAPPLDAGDGEIERLLAAVDRADGWTEPVMHRLFGPLTAAQAKTLTLAHCANHLGNLVPTA